MLTARKLVMVLGMVIGALFLSGCAGTGAPLTRQLNMDRLKSVWSGPSAEFYVSAPTSLRKAPSQSAGVVSRVGRNARVAELERDQRGWSRVKVSETGATGWVASYLLSDSPVASKAAESAAKSQDRRRSAPEGVPLKDDQPVRQGEVPSETATTGVKPADPAAAESQAGAESGTGTTPSKGSWPSLVSPAEAAEPPATDVPARKEPAERRGRPEMFDPF